VKVRVHDGVEIAVALYMPDGEGPFPTVLGASPYRYDNNILPASPQFLRRTAAHALIGLAGADYGVAIVLSIALVEDKSLRAVPLVLLGAAIGHWEAVCWEPRRVAPAYVDTFVSELAAYARNTFPGRKFVRRAPRLPAPTAPVT
jgi:hypothetical protein